MNIKKFSKEVKINDEVWCPTLDCSMRVANIRVDSNGRPLFDLSSYTADNYGTEYIARFEEILEIY